MFNGCSNLNNYHLNSLYLSCCFILSSFSFSVYAEQSNKKDTIELPSLTIESHAISPYGLQLKEQATTGSRLGLTPMQTPANIEVITGETIEARGDLTVREAVVRATGITSNPTSGNGGTSLVARGFAGHSSVMQLYDGTRLFTALGTVTFPFDTWAIDRIEILHGPSSVLYGEGAIGGAINVIPKKPTQGAIKNKARFTVGSFDTYRAAYSSSGGLNDKLSYVGSLHTGKSNGWMHRGDTEYTMFSGALKLEPTTDFNMTLFYDFGHQNPSIYAGTPLVNNRIKQSIRKNNYRIDGAKLDYKDTWIRLNSEWTPTDKMTIRNNLYYLESKRHWKNAEQYNWNSKTSLLDIKGYYEILHDQKQIGNRFDVTFDNHLANLKNKTTLGFDVNRIDFSVDNNSPYTAKGPSVSIHDTHVGGWRTTNHTRINAKTVTKQGSLFMEDQLYLLENWSVLGGIRYDHFDLQRNNKRAPNTSWTSNLHKATWRLGTVYQFTPDFSLYGQYATAADPLSAVVTTSDAQKDFGLTKAKQYEVGMKQLLWNQKAEWTLALYKIEKNNLLSYDDVTKTSTPVGKQSSKGIELAFAVQLLPTVRVDANGTVLEARYNKFDEKGISRRGNVPSSTPEKAANAWLSWEFIPDWTVRPGLRYVGRRFNDPANDVKIPSFTVWDASLDWKMNKNITWSLHGYNLTDKIYAEAAYNSGKQWVLGKPRSVELALDINF